LGRCSRPNPPAAAAVEETTGDESRRAIGSGAAGAFALWLLLCGLVLVGVAALLT
jgi:hypothetical protein